MIAYSATSLCMPTLVQLKQAVSIAEQIEELQAKLASLVGGSGSVAPAPKAASTSAVKAVKSGKRTMSPEARARIAAAQRARWAKSKGTTAKAPVAAPKKKRGKLSPEGRAKIVAALKARWAAKRAGKK
jgi:hypothetical protein